MNLEWQNLLALYKYYRLIKAQAFLCKGYTLNVLWESSGISVQRVYIVCLLGKLRHFCAKGIHCMSSGKAQAFLFKRYTLYVFWESSGISVQRIRIYTVYLLGKLRHFCAKDIHCISFGKAQAFLCTGYTLYSFWESIVFFTSDPKLYDNDYVFVLTFIRNCTS